MKRFLSITFLLTVLVMLLVAACNVGPEEAPTPTLVIPTPPTATALAAIAPTATSTTSVPASPTPLPLPPTATLPPPTASETPAPSATPVASGPAEYLVVFVEPDDSLNMRDGAGIEHDVVATLEPGASGISLEEGRQLVDESRWVEIRSEDVSGWVNDGFLTEWVPPEAFCTDRNARQALQDFIDGFQMQQPLMMTSQPDASLRGLRIRHDWWNEEVRFANESLSALFTDDEAQDWGNEMGSGRPLEGSFADVIQPLLEKDLLGGTQIGCNEILHGPTAGIVQLPESYEGINYFSVYRTAPEDGFEFDWGTWVVGVERWEGQYIVTFLVHYAWEI